MRQRRPRDHELTSWGIVHPTLWKLEHKEQVRAEKLV
jgi:hypothetical protein